MPSCPPVFLSFNLLRGRLTLSTLISDSVHKLGIFSSKCWIISPEGHCERLRHSKCSTQHSRRSFVSVNSFPLCTSLVHSFQDFESDGILCFCTFHPGVVAFYLLGWPGRTWVLPGLLTTACACAIGPPLKTWESFYVWKLSVKSIHVRTRLISWRTYVGWPRKKWRPQ